MILRVQQGLLSDGVAASLSQLCGLALVKSAVFFQPLAAVQHNNGRVRPLP